MSFLLDECTPLQYLDMLTAWGYTAVRSVDYASVGAPDDDVLKVASKENAVVVSVDKDFLNVIQFPPEHYAGIIVIRDDHRARNSVSSILKMALKILYPGKISGKLIIIEATGYKIFPPDDASIPENSPTESQ